MSRAIRCWDTANKEWVPDDEFYVHPSGEIMVHDGEGRWEEGPRDIYKRCDSTGLHDKNGVPIWEGDVVQSKDGIIEVEHRFASGGCTEFPISGQYNSSLFSVPFPCEVIGNIHSNPELLS